MTNARSAEAMSSAELRRVYDDAFAARFMDEGRVTEADAHDAGLRAVATHAMTVERRQRGNRR